MAIQSVVPQASFGHPHSVSPVSNEGPSYMDVAPPQMFKGDSVARGIQPVAQKRETDVTEEYHLYKRDANGNTLVHRAVIDNNLLRIQAISNISYAALREPNSDGYSAMGLALLMERKEITDYLTTLPEYRKLNRDDPMDPSIKSTMQIVQESRRYVARKLSIAPENLRCVPMRCDDVALMSVEEVGNYYPDASIYPRGPITSDLENLMLD